MKRSAFYLFFFFFFFKNSLAIFCLCPVKTETPVWQALYKCMVRTIPYRTDLTVNADRDKSRRRTEMTAMKWPCSGHQKGQLQLWGQNTFLIQGIGLFYYLIIQWFKWKVLFSANIHRENNLRISGEFKWCYAKTVKRKFVLEFLSGIFSLRE